MKLRVLDLFSGIGGFSLGLERTGGFETAAFCEYAEFPRKVLAKHWPDVPIYPDVRELTAERFDADGLGPIDLICGGYPCQPFSHAGKRLGAEDDRHLWPEMFRLIASLRPAWVIGENVAGHVSMGLDDVLSDLGTLGYSAQAFVIPACALGASHRRDRTWVVAYGENERVDWRIGQQSHDCKSGAQWNFGQGRRGPDDGNKDVADPLRHNVQGFVSECLDSKRWAESHQRQVGSCGDGGGWWTPEPDVGRVAHGVPHRVDRLKALGNAVVPQIPEMIGRAILQSMKEAA
jgi:DNA (cytosine-5)-methyltransferase 1